MTLSASPLSNAHRAEHLRAHLFVVSICPRPVVGGSRHALDSLDVVDLARGDALVPVRAGRQLCVSVPDPHMSSAHARLVRGHTGWVLTDRGSKNGVHVGEARITRHSLVDGDVFILGHTLFCFRAALPTDDAAAQDMVGTGASPAFATLLPSYARRLDDLAQAARTTIPILLFGETGTGKEVLARSLHAISTREGPFVGVNCGALPATLVESELFGAAKGAYSGALVDRAGLVLASAGGTLLLDEIGDLATNAQATLLRVLQEREVTRLGATKPIKVDLRVISATHVDLDAAALDGRFRADLLARLSGFVFRLPALRERKEDLGLILGGILGRMAEEGAAKGDLSPRAGMRLLGYGWPRNAREVEQVLRRAAVVARGGTIRREHLPETFGHSARDEAPLAADVEDDAFRARLLRLLAETHGNVSAVASRLATSRSQVHRWMERFGVDGDSLRAMRRKR